MNSHLNMAFKLFPWQESAVARLKPGSILYGQVGSGKTMAALAYVKWYYPEVKLYVITTAKKRDTGDWESEAYQVGIRNIVADSWNNIKKYQDVTDAFFIFDEQRVVGYGSWSKAFIKIARNNTWILLSGTPGDVWMDYMPVFIANGYYKNKTDFISQHVEYDRFAKYPKIKSYHNTGKLMKIRNEVLIPMPVMKKTRRHILKTETHYDKKLYNDVVKYRWNPYKDQPIETPSEYTQVLRRIVATSRGRKDSVKELISSTDRLIIFYNYDYERSILMQLCKDSKKEYSQWNGHKHEEVPFNNHWVYLVQYTAGAEGWNCTETDTILFYSPNYSFKMMEQAQGRIDRINTTYKDLNYYLMYSKSPIDVAVLGAINKKKRFNASAWAREALPNVGEQVSGSLKAAANGNISWSSRP